MMIWTAICSIFISLVVIVLGVWYGHRLQDRIGNEMPQTVSNESDESKILMIAMRCHSLEQEVDMLRLMIEELEDKNSKTSTNENVCGQYWIYQSGITNDPVELKEQTISNPLAVDDLIQ